MNRRKRFVIIALIILLVLTIIITTAIGSTSISPNIVAKILLYKFLYIEKTWSVSHEVIINDIRLPRVLLGALVGAALGTAGCAMQGLLKNPMADPYIIGISSGAAVGASLAFVLLLPVQIVSFVFAAISIFVVYNISKVGGKVPVDTLLLSGIAVGSLLAAMTSLIIYTAGVPHQIIFWLMGGLWTADWEKVKISAVMVIFGVLMIYKQGWNLNVMLLGEEQASYLGIDIEHVKRYVLLFAALITASAVSVSGIIGFVGLIIPHIMRILTGPDHRILLPASALAGAIFLVSTDAIARVIMEPAELPVGIITALFGAPFFIYLLRKRRKSIYV
ncbi:MAG: iron chelate uptake ABC transporter family permease subunit [Euryarchaeota archaeon]|nr:iron chelate uptake ABC transporter family permease subunit [Euryarchaeota archaeon]